MIDIGVNLTHTRFDKDRLAVIERAKQAKLSALLITGTDIEQSEQAIALCQQAPNFLFCTAGIHPHDADQAQNNYLEQLEQLAQHSSVKAIGECGLDFNRNFSTPENQQRIFQGQVELAAQLQLPLFLHQRDAFEPWFKTLAPYITRVPAMVAHCFTGSKYELEQCLAAGMYIGITGWVCDERRGQTLREIVPLIPLQRLMIETDAPYLTPRTIRPKPKSSRNEPSYLPYIVTMLAKLLNCSEQALIQQTTANSEQVFNLRAADA
ncbi:Sec-independent protein translocase TatD [Colwellia chukchiensis]|uniref:Sec-independent protein translocase TatD n=1 Tax=Colwellia chukchiensis TaxID=641665 RepID=A0A1H7PA43_9GAMM|nr:TatD family hydrolase [Colwellia chukchiensis]SEL32125.1 Sec-independent protein translocase TatD [Colwellia chukchiensis]